MGVQFSDLLTVGLLVVLEGLLSADNALVLAVMILGLRRRDQHKALRYGIVGGFVMRIAATLLAIYLMRLGWVKLLGGLYLLYLSYKHFFASGSAEERVKPRPAKRWLGLPPLWATVVKVELVNIAFSVDSILVAVAMSPKTWVVLTGGLLGIVMMRVVIAQLLAIVRRYPTIVDGAFVIIAWVGFKLLLEFAKAMRWIAMDVPRSVYLGLIVLIFVVAYAHARQKGPVEEVEAEAEALLRESE